MSDPAASPDDPLAALGAPPPPPPGPGQALLFDMPVDAFLATSLDVEPEVPAEQMRLVPGLISYWNAKHAEAVADFAHAERARKAYRARKRQELRASGVKITVDGIEDAVEVDDQYIAHQIKCIEAETRALKAAGNARAMEAKKAMLMSLGGFLRDELRGDPQLRQSKW